ncbi:MAG: transcription antitermination factor NusB [Verrucomicrobiota bacterium]|jgi:N utilization substance protein B|nr:transcription antitermination factor NusB [Verrucomicrobiota bacterium]
MGLRHDAREWALQFLFQSEFNQDASLNKAFQYFWQFQDEIASVPPAMSVLDPAEQNLQHTRQLKARRFAEELARGVISEHNEIDKILTNSTSNWEIDRMGTVERNVMRLAVFEMLRRKDIPPVVSINEAVELAKSYSSIESGKFVNGILDRIRMAIDRPAREVADDLPAPSTETP